MRSAIATLFFLTVFLLGCGRGSFQQASPPKDTVPALSTADVKGIGGPPGLK
jgi:hypothetical protein